MELFDQLYPDEIHLPVRFGVRYLVRDRRADDQREFIAFVMLSNVFLGPIKQINAVIEMYPKGIAGFKRYLERESEPDVADSPGAKPVNHLRGDIAFHGISFGYENKDQVADVNLSIRAGETVALVGPSGAGKTTLCSLAAFL